MIGEWVRRNAVAAIVFAVAGSGLVGGLAVYLLQPAATPAALPPAEIAKEAPSAPLPPSALPDFPMRFQVKVSGRIGSRELGNFKYEPIMGEGSFVCDLRKVAEMICMSPPFNNSIMGSRIEIMRYARDPARVTMKVLGPVVDDITWPMLSKGVTVNGTRVVAIAGG